jgi:acyl-CoA reductase-like NAD-dependent aldehyde dehydrogenase
MGVIDTARRTGTELDVLDPATGDAIGRIPAGSAEAADSAVGTARRAQPGWARTEPAERAALLKAGARRLREHARELAELQTREGGKPLTESLGAVDAGIAAIERYAEIGPLHRGRSLQGAWEATDLTVHEPRGVAALLVPWSDPVAIACAKIAAALVTGNTVVYKPSEKAPLTAERIVELLDIPGDALVLLQGDSRAGRPLVAHEGVDLVVHTGSVHTGRQVARACAGRHGAVLLELGGKDALIVDAGVDPAWAAEQTALGAFANAGQVCTSIERVFVHETVAEPFLGALAERAQTLRMGSGLDPETEMGPLIDDEQRMWVHRHVQDAVHDGAELLAGGEIPDGPGFFYPPTVLAGPALDAPVLCQETFGPVAAVRTIASFDTALREAAACELGRAATVLTPSQANAQRAVRELPVDTVRVNEVLGTAPGSGYGPELLDEFTRTKVLHLAPYPGSTRGH